MLPISGSHTARLNKKRATFLLPFSLSCLELHNKIQMITDRKIHEEEKREFSDAPVFSLLWEDLSFALHAGN